MAGRSQGRKLEQPKVIRNRARIRGQHPGGLFVTRLTPELHEVIVKHVASGADVETAAAAAGVTVQTLRRWLIRGRDALLADEIPEGEQIFADLAYDLDGVLARWEVEELERMAKHGDYDWRASAWLLEHRLPHKYGRRSTIEIGNANGEPFRIDAAPLDSIALTHLRELREKFAQVRGALPSATEDQILEGEYEEVGNGGNTSQAA